MKEQEYIDLSDMVLLESIRKALREIIPANSDVIKNSDYRMVLNIIASWIEKLKLEQIKIED